LEGLEISEVNISEILGTEQVRFEAEFHTAKTLKFKKFKKGEQITEFVQYGTSEELNEESIGYPTLRLNEFDRIFISKPSKYCNKIDFENFENLKLKKYDILICRTNGNPKLVGKAAIVYEDAEYAFASYLFRIRPKIEFINPETLTIFLNSKYGRQEIEKYSMASNQVNFSPAKFREINIPIFEINFQNEIALSISKSYNLIQKSKKLYSEAEQLLLEELNLQNFEKELETEELNINIKSFQNSFLNTGRLDSEYYQKKYELIENKIRSYKGGCKKLFEIVNITKSIETGSDAYSGTGIPYIRVSNISKQGIITPDICISDKYYNENKETLDKLKLKKDTILFTKDGTIGIAYKVQEDMNMITSGALLHLNVINKNEILPDCLALILNSMVVQKQAERDSGGSIIIHWRMSEIENVLVPTLNIKTQQKITEKIQESFNLRTESEKLLSLAKQAVETAIEKGEEEGMELIDNYIKIN
jgi:restriction endonuclease S subunit